jgi:uncharacterized RDD family membrane protein YckC
MIPLMHQSAPIWRRVAALVYDSFILLALSFVYGAMVTVIATYLGYTANDYHPMFRGFLFPCGWALTLVGFYCFFWRLSGQTIGMRTWHIKVVQSADGQSLPSVKQCLLRALIAAPAVVILGCGYFYAVIQAAKKTPQDLISGTTVIFLK